MKIFEGRFNSNDSFSKHFGYVLVPSLGHIGVCFQGVAAEESGGLFSTMFRFGRSQKKAANIKVVFKQRYLGDEFPVGNVCKALVREALKGENTPNSCDERVGCTLAVLAFAKRLDLALSKECKGYANVE